MKNVYKMTKYYVDFYNFFFEKFFKLKKIEKEKN